jgi:hypothetical protein
MSVINFCPRLDRITKGNEGQLTPGLQGPQKDKQLRISTHIIIISTQVGRGQIPAVSGHTQPARNKSMECVQNEKIVK